MNDYEQLRSRGWTVSDIQRAQSIIGQAQQKKPENVRVLDALVYWFVLGVAIIGNFIISIILIPFLVALKGWVLYGIIIVISASFGAFFDLLIRDLEHVSNKEVILAGLFLPVLALINVMIVVNLSNQLAQKLSVNLAHQNPIFVSVAYVVAFMLPYLIKTGMQAQKTAKAQ